MSSIQVNICRSFYLKRITSPTNYLIGRLFSSENDKPLSPKMQEFKRKLRQTSPLGQLDEQPFDHPAQEKEPLKPWPNNTNPHTGEVNGPKGPEPTRYGDWERKGRVSDF